MAKERFTRQELLFGREGQRKIEREHVAIVGLGGLGSHVAQQLAYLGVRSFALIDSDVVEDSNLNRLVFATPSDVADEKLKVDVVEHGVLGISPNAVVTTIPDSFTSEEGFEALNASTFVFGCVDDDAARLVLNEYAQAYEKPYLDIATDIEPGGPGFGGRLVFADGNGCVSCWDVLDQEAIRLSTSSEKELEEDERIYGVNRAALQRAGPAVVSLNGILASVAVTEFMVECTGIRPSRPHLEYKGAMGIITQPQERLPGCYYCESVRGKREAANVERHITASAATL